MLNKLYGERKKSLIAHYNTIQNAIILGLFIQVFKQFYRVKCVTDFLSRLSQSEMAVCPRFVESFYFTLMHSEHIIRRLNI